MTGTFDNVARARQLVVFDGMKMRGIAPTDVDAVVEYKDAAWMVFEVKRRGKPVPTGQRVAMERFVRDMWRVGKAAFAAVVENDVDDPREDVDLAKCEVRAVYMGGEFEWRRPRRKMTARGCMAAYIEYAGRRKK